MRDFESAQAKRYDIIVVGGGIYGAAMAWEAVSRGLTVVLLESHDFGHATSANSLKMIHGGIRYLQNLDIQRLRESVHERRALLRIAPHLVSPLKCLLPTQNNLTTNRITVNAAFQLYNFLSRKRNVGVDPLRYIPAAGVMNKKELLDEIPMLKDVDCTGAGYWYDAQVHNSERLVLSFVLSASNEGATVLNYAVAEELLKSEGAVKGVVVRDSLTNCSFELRADAVVDCTGPWSKWNYESFDKSSEPVFAKAVNLVVNKALFPCAIGLKSNTTIENESAGRQLFIAPWRGQSIIGTWYFPVSDRLKHLCPTKQEFDECLEQANSLLPQLTLKVGDVGVVHSGLLPAESPIDQSCEPVLKRKPSIVEVSKYGGPRGLFCVQGVKLTTARDIAQTTIDLVCKSMKKNVLRSDTDSRPLYGGNISDIAMFSQKKISMYSNYLPEGAVIRLIENYGTNIDTIMNYIKVAPCLAKLVPGTTSLLIAEINFVVEHEIVTTLSDLLSRRVDVGALAVPKQETIDFCAEFLSEKLGWDERTKSENIDSLIDSYFIV